MWPSIPPGNQIWLKTSVLAGLSVSIWLLAGLDSVSVLDTRAVSLVDKQSQSDQMVRTYAHERKLALSWEDIFGMNLSLSMSPMEFYDAVYGITSRQLTDLLKESELNASDIMEWLENEQNMTLHPSDLSKDLRALAKTYGPDRLGTFNLRRGFKGTPLYYEIESILCDIASEKGTHFHFLGDSTVQGLLGNGLNPFLKDCRRPYSRKTRLHGGIKGDKKTSFYYQRAFNATFEDEDYSVPAGVKRAIVIANFDSLHALSLFPARRFETLPDGRLFFHVFDDFVQYQLDKVSQYPLDTYLITVGPNAVAEERFTDGYLRSALDYEQNPADYAKRCSSSWEGVSYEMCRDAPMNRHGARYLHERIASLMPTGKIDVDAYYITENQGYLSPEGDGRHFKPLAHLKIVQIIVVYMVRRIEKHLTMMQQSLD